MAVCGICHEDDLLDVGEIDSCEHRFCHQCISKWSEIESKCPFCKLRFSCITRRLLASPLKGNLSPNRPLVGKVIGRTEVPERDQRVVFEDPTFLEWLEGLACIICHGSENEDQLLLCDGCDQACHTYCLGLSSVPEEAWFCSTCQEQRNRAQEALHHEDSIIEEDVQRTEPRRRSRLRSFAIVDDSEEEEDDDGCRQVQDSVSTGAVSDDPIRRSRRIQVARNVEHQRRSRRVQSTPANGQQRDRERIASLQQNWESLREGSMSFEEILDTSDDDEIRITSRDAKRARGGSPAIDLTSGKSPDAQIPGRMLRTGQFSPPLLDLRSRLQKELLEHEREYVGIPPDAFTTPNHQTSRPPSGTWRQREGRVTTLGDLTFGASVAAGRTTPKSSGQKWPAPPHQARASTSGGQGELFAHKTQAMVHAMANAGGSNSPKPLRERVDMRYRSNDAFNRASLRSLEYLHSRQEGMTTRISPIELHGRNLHCSNKALDLVDEQIEILFGSDLPREKQKYLRHQAVRKLCQKYPDEIDGDHAAWAVDEVLKGMSAQSH